MLEFYVWFHLRKTRARKVDMQRVNAIVETLCAVLHTAVAMGWLLGRQWQPVVVSWRPGTAAQGALKTKRCFSSAARCFKPSLP